MDFLTEFLQNGFFTQIQDFIFGYLDQGLAWFDTQDILIQLGVLVGGAVVVVLGTIDLIKKLSKLIFVAVVLFALWFVYTNYVA
jgi:hypothetical protein